MMMYESLEPDKYMVEWLDYLITLLRKLEQVDLLQKVQVIVPPLEVDHCFDVGVQQTWYYRGLSIHTCPEVDDVGPHSPLITGWLTNVNGDENGLGPIDARLDLNSMGDGSILLHAEKPTNMPALQIWDKLMSLPAKDVALKNTVITTRAFAESPVHRNVCFHQYSSYWSGLIVGP